MNLFLDTMQQYIPLIIALSIIFIPVVILLFIVVIKLLVKHFKRGRVGSKKEQQTIIKNKYLAPFGVDNIISISVEMTRVKVEVKEMTKVSIDGLKELGVGVLISGNTIKCSSAEFANSLSEENK